MDGDDQAMQGADASADSVDLVIMECSSFCLRWVNMKFNKLKVSWLFLKLHTMMTGWRWFSNAHP